MCLQIHLESQVTSEQHRDECEWKPKRSWKMIYPQRNEKTPPGKAKKGSSNEEKNTEVWTRSNT